METKGVKICEYCSKMINPKEIFIQDIEREGNQINHEADYHQECFINSMIKDLEVLGFEIIRPRAEINKNLKRDNDNFDLNPKEIKAAMDIATPMLDALFSGSPTLETEKLSKEDLKKVGGKDKYECVSCGFKWQKTPKVCQCGSKKFTLIKNNQNGEKKEQKKPTVTRKGK